MTSIQHLVHISIFALVLLACKSQAQDMAGLHLSNYGGLYRTTYNPSTLGNTPYKFQINGMTLGGSIGRRYFDFFGKNSFLTPILSSNSNEEIYGRSRTMKSLLERKIYLQSEIKWPSILFSIKDRHGFALQARTRGYIYGNAPEEVKTLYNHRMDSDLSVTVKDLPNGDIYIQQQSLSDLSFSYGVSVINTKSHKLKFGITGKMITGARLSSLEIIPEKFSIKSSTINLDTKELYLDNVSYTAYSTSELKKQKLPPLFDRSNYGSGWAYDWGITYELGNVWKNKQESFDKSPTYFLRLGVSVTDIGKINYSTQNARYVSGQLNQFIIDQQSMEHITNNGAKGFMDLISTDPSPFLPMHSISLPSMLHLEADIQLAKSVFLNASRSSSLVSTNHDAFKGHLSNLTYTRITPRFEGQDFDLAFPITFIDDNTKPQIGVTAHFGPLFISFSNATGIFLPKEEKRAAMAYIGLSVFKLKK